MGNSLTLRLLCFMFLTSFSIKKKNPTNKVNAGGMVRCCGSLVGKVVANPSIRPNLTLRGGDFHPRYLVFSKNFREFPITG